MCSHALKPREVGGEPVISRAVCVQAVSSERLVRNGGPVLVFDFSLFILVEFVK